MEAYKDGLKGYWKRRGYHRLDGGGGRGRLNRAELGGERPRRRRFWRVKIAPKLRLLRKLSPLRLLARIRDAYVRMMLKLAHTPAFGYGGYGGGAGMAGFGRPPLKEYDEKMIVELYKAILAKGPLIVGGGCGSEAGRASAVDVRQ